MIYPVLSFYSPNFSQHLHECTRDMHHSKFQSPLSSLPYVSICHYNLPAVTSRAAHRSHSLLGRILVLHPSIFFSVYLVTRKTCPALHITSCNQFQSNSTSPRAKLPALSNALNFPTSIVGFALGLVQTTRLLIPKSKPPHAAI